MPDVNARIVRILGIIASAISLLTEVSSNSSAQGIQKWLDAFGTQEHTLAANQRFSVVTSIFVEE